MSLDSSLSAERAALSLSRLLAQLQKNLLLTPDSDPAIAELCSSRYQRTRVGSNIEHARLLVLQIDSIQHASENGTNGASPKTLRPFAWPASRLSANHTNVKEISVPSTADLKKQKALIIRLQQRLDELERRGHHAAQQTSGTSRRRTWGVSTKAGTSVDDDYAKEKLNMVNVESDDEDGERMHDSNILNVYFPDYLKSAQAYSKIDSRDGSRADSRGNASMTTMSRDESDTSPSQALATTNSRKANDNPASVLRSRQPASTGKVNNIALTTGANASPWVLKEPEAISKSSVNDGAATARLLESHEDEQTALTASLLSLASELKSSTQAFSAGVNDSNPLVDHATAALDANMNGMEGASSRMKMLRRMTEGKGWWDRLGLWARVGVLWIALILVWAVIPPLRIF